MNRPIPLPAELPDDAFRTSAALSAGATPGRLRALNLDRSVWGMRSATEVVDFQHRCRLFQQRMPLSFFSHATAALLHNLPVPLHLSSTPLLDVSLRRPDRAPHAAGIVGHQLAVDDFDLTTVHGLRVTTAARTWMDLGGVLRVPDLVAAGDAALANESATLHQLESIVSRHPGSRGVARLRIAVEILNPLAESPQESGLRAVLISAGLPHPTVNHELRTAGGTFVARIDLAYPDSRIAIEYQGDYHRDRDQWRADLVRRNRVEHLGWTVMEVGADDLRSPGQLIARVRGLLKR